MRAGGFAFVLSQKRPMPATTAEARGNRIFDARITAV